MTAALLVECKGNPFLGELMGRDSILSLPTATAFPSYSGKPRFRLIYRNEPTMDPCQVPLVDGCASRGACPSQGEAALGARLSAALLHDCRTAAFGAIRGPFPERLDHPVGLPMPPQQKTPLRGGGALLGLLQGGEICISIYVDRWEVGEPFLCRGRRCGKQPGPYDGAGLDLRSLVCCSYIGSST